VCCSSVTIKPAMAFNHEIKRLETFTTVRDNFAVNVEELARFGFYFSSPHLSQDSVVCVFCGLIVCKWEVDDDPLIVHLSYKPDCPLMRNDPNLNNVPINAEKLRLRLPKFKGYDVCGNKEMIDFSSLPLRLKSFDKWPISLKQSKESMVDAGFYYLEKGDRVRCFSCTLQLKDWEPEDDPWIEHIKHNSKCLYVVQQKGEMFIQRVLSQPKKEEVISSSEEETPHVSSCAIECSVCRLEPIKVSFDPCGHCFCKSCNYKLEKCPICREEIVKRLTLYV